MTFRAGPAPDDPVIGTISIAGPTVRIRRDRWDELVAELRTAADEISQYWPLRKRQRQRGTKSMPLPKMAPSE